MSADQVFSVASMAAMLGWLVLAAGAVTRRMELVRLAGLVWPLALASLYTMLIIFFFAKAPGGFDSLAHVQELFTDHWAALAGWVHYLAFDLFIGGWITAEVLRLALPRLALIVLLPLTFLFGPIGLLLFFITKLALGNREVLA
jgi:hypothetical protein